MTSTMHGIMIQGASSDAGKSLLTTALCRWLHRRGIRCAPFKAQNMSNNARVVNGGEIGVAQWLQALAARAFPDTRMNPVLLKPEGDRHSQVVLNGVVSRELTELAWRERADALWPHVQAALESLRGDFDVIVAEGAGSPAETNLWSDDIANMRVAEFLHIPVLIVADIDRGGAFAHLYGTWALMPSAWRERVIGFILNKFRGDPELLDPGPRHLESLCGVPTRGVIPWVDHHLPDEEGPTKMPRGSGLRVHIICGPYASNLDEFVGLQQVADVSWVRDASRLSGADLVVLPGSKHVPKDLAWLRHTGLSDEIVRAAQEGTRILGICGGLQMLGHRILDPHGVEGTARGLGLLPIEIEYAPTKRTRDVWIEAAAIPEPWSWLSNRRIAGYEIRYGETRPHREATPVFRGAGYIDKNILGIHVHGLLEDPGVLKALCGEVPRPLDETFELLADVIEEHFEVEWLSSMFASTARRP